MVERLVVFGLVISFLTGCAAKPPKAQAANPGTSLSLRYPVLLVGDRNLVVKDDENSLITTTVSSGLNFPQYVIIDSGGDTYSVVTVTEFGRQSLFSDMGTRPYQVFLELKRKGTISVADAKALTLRTALAANGPTDGTVHGAEIARQKIESCQTLAQLIEACRKTWEWR
jgi:hypothetical protein